LVSPLEIAHLEGILPSRWYPKKDFYFFPFSLFKELLPAFRKIKKEEVTTREDKL